MARQYVWRAQRGCSGPGKPGASAVAMGGSTPSRVWSYNYHLSGVQVGPHSVGVVAGWVSQPLTTSGYYC